MLQAIGIGIAAIDVIHEVATYPQEDSKGRALASRKVRGGNGTNALVVCAQLLENASVYWLGMSLDPSIDPDAAFVHQDLHAHGVDCSYCTLVTEGSMPISYILASRSTGSRTIIHSRDLPELSYDDFCHQLMKILRNQSSTKRWFHFEGRDMANVHRMMQFLHEHKAEHDMVSVEIEALRYDWSLAKALLSCAHVAFVSKDYIRTKLQLPDATALFEFLRTEQLLTDRTIICPWGDQGVYYHVAGTSHHLPSKPIPQIVDSVGAGDSFIGASIAALGKGISTHQAMAFACDVAATKCQQRGFTFSIDQRSRWHHVLQS